MRKIKKILDFIKSELASTLSSIAIIITFFSILLIALDLLTNDDTTISARTESRLNSENSQYKIRKNESQFRERIYLDVQKLLSDKEFQLLDSVEKNAFNGVELKKYIVLNKLKNGRKKHKFKIKVEELTTPFVELEWINVSFEIDFDRLDRILQSSKSPFDEDKIKYGNFLRTQYTFDKKVRIDYLIITIFGVIVLFGVSYFIDRNVAKKALELEDLKSDQEKINEAEELIGKDGISKKEFEDLKGVILEMKRKMDEYKFDSVLSSVLYLDVSKAEKKSMELYDRSTLMLVSGLLTAVVGILVFYFTLPDFNQAKSATDYLALTIRPTMMLLFVQSISFYLLRQYRSLINDYKFFYEEYLKKSKIFLAFQLIQSNASGGVEEKLVDSLLGENRKENTVLTEDEISNDKLYDLIKTIIEKVK